MASDLSNAIRAALQTNPDVGIVAENRRAVRYELRQAESRFLPTVDLRAAYGPEWTNDSTTRNRARTTGKSRTTEFGKTEFSLTLTQMLFDGWDTQSNVDRQRARDTAAARRVMETSEFIALDAVEAYLESLRQRELTALAEENVRVHEQVLQLVEVKAAGGAATTADVQQAQSRLAAAEATLTEAQTRLRDADATYARVIGEAPTDLSRPVPPYFALPPSVETAIDLSLENNPTISVNRADLEVVRREYENTLAAFWPTVDLELNANANNNTGGTRGSEVTGSALVVMRYNLYRGGEDTNRRREFSARIAEERQRLNRTIRLTEEEMRISFNALTSARERIVAQRREVAANARVVTTYRQQFDLGGRNLLELLDSENELFVARGGLISTEFLEMFSAYRVLATAGILLSALDVPELKESIGEHDPMEPIRIDLEPGIDQEIPPNAPGGAPDPMEGVDRGGFTAPPPGADLPVLDPNAPVFDPNTPPLDPTAPVLDPNAALLDPNAPVLDPNAPVFDPNAPPLDPTAPVLDPNAALLDPNAPVLDPNAPIFDPNAPVFGPNAPVLDPNAPPLEPESAPEAAPIPRAEALDGQAEPLADGPPDNPNAAPPPPGIAPLMVPGPGASLGPGAPGGSDARAGPRQARAASASVPAYGWFAPPSPPEALAEGPLDPRASQQGALPASGWGALP